MQINKATAFIEVTKCMEMCFGTQQTIIDKI